MNLAVEMHAATERTGCNDAGPSLLAADSEEEPSSGEENDLEDNRPSLLPINEVIKTAPHSLSQLLDVMVPRLQQRSSVKGVSSDDQQSFVSILVGELSSKFSDLKEQIDDPFLSPQKNKALRRLVAIQVCRILENLYGQYTAKAARICSDGVLSSVAHMSRLRAQLAIQANKSINLSAIRRQVLSQLRGPLPTSHPCHLPRVPQWQPPHTTHKQKTNLDHLDLGAPLSSKLLVSSLAPGDSCVLRRRRVEKLTAAMTPHKYTSQYTVGTTDRVSNSVVDSTSDVTDSQSITQHANPEQHFKLERPPSMPELYGNFLLCDWKLVKRTPYHIASPGDQRRERRHQALCTARRSSIDSKLPHDVLKWTSEQIQVETKLGDYTRDDLNSDLHQLSETDPSFIHSVAKDDIDPLLQACGHGLSKRQKSRLEAHDLKLRVRQEEEQRKMKDEEERKMREGEAVPTLEDMEKMQFLSTQAPQSISHSHASLHMGSNTSDWQTHSEGPSSQLQYNSTIDGLQDEVADVIIEVDQWSDQVGSQDVISQTALSCTAVSGINNFSPSLSDHSISSVGSHLLNQDQHSNVNSTSGHHNNIESLLEEHDSLHSTTLTANHTSTSHLDTSSQHCCGSTTSIISDRQQQFSLQHDDGSTSEHSEHIQGGSSILLDHSHYLQKHQEQHQLRSNYPSLTSRISSNPLPPGSSRNLLASDSVGPAGSSRNLLASGPAGSSRNLLAPNSVGIAGSSRNLLASGPAGSSRNLLASGSVGPAGSSGNLLAPSSAVLAGEDMCQSGISIGSERGRRSNNSDMKGSFSDVKSFSQATFSDLESHEERGPSENEELHPQPQPAVITTTINDKIIRSSDLCVSERAPLTTLRLKPYKPIWNELTGELNRKTVDELDSNLTEGQEMDILYHELMRTIPKDYLDMESEQSLIPAVSDSVDIASVLASSSLPHRPSNRVINPDLCPMSDQQPPPWGDKTKKEQWKNNNLYTGPDPKELMAPKGSTLTPAQARLRQQYLNWLKWWRSTVSTDDYLKFVAQKDCDYLHHIYHLYDSEGSESEADEERDKKERLIRLHSKLQAKHAKREERYTKKTQYEHGMWNVNTVLMGGLEGDPDTSGTSSDEDIEDQLRELEQNKKEPEEDIQQRFQTVWSQLQLSQQQSIEMAIKYSSHQYQQYIKTAIYLWERVCKLIEEREKQLDQLQRFEKSASDPSRLFPRGQDGSSTSLLQEAKRRKLLHSALDNVDRKLSRTLRKLKSRFGDVVTYKDRVYHEKMRHDRTELLYRLQQERRKTFLKSPSSVSSDNRTSPITLS